MQSWETILRGDTISFVGNSVHTVQGEEFCTSGQRRSEKGNHWLAEHVIFTASKQVLSLSVYGIETAGASGWHCCHTSPAHNVTIVFTYEGNSRSPNNHTDKEKHVYIHLFRLGLCKVPLFHTCLWLCGYCQGKAYQNGETGEVSPLGTLKDTVNPQLMIWVGQWCIRCSVPQELFTVQFNTFLI